MHMHTQVCACSTHSNLLACSHMLKFGQMMKTFYAMYSAWLHPAHAVFLYRSPKREVLYARLYTVHHSPADGDHSTHRRGGVLSADIRQHVQGVEVNVARLLHEG